MLVSKDPHLRLCESVWDFQFMNAMWELVELAATQMPSQL